MTTLERIKELCREEKITIAKLEKELGFSNGSISKPKTIPSDRIAKIADRFGVTSDYLITGESTEQIQILQGLEAFRKNRNFLNAGYDFGRLFSEHKGTVFELMEMYNAMDPLKRELWLEMGRQLMDKK